MSSTIWQVPLVELANLSIVNKRARNLDFLKNFEDFYYKSWTIEMFFEIIYKLYFNSGEKNNARSFANGRGYGPKESYLRLVIH